METPNSPIELSIVIPCLNEEKTLPIVINKCFNTLKRLGINGEVIVADNGSTDSSVQIAESLGARVVHVPKRGYGNALIGGMSAARGKYIIIGDADDSYNFEEIDDFIKHIREDHNIVIGTRLKGNIEKGAMPFLHRYLGTPVLTFVLNRLFKPGISDCNCGMRCLTKDSFDRLKLESPGMEFASEMMIKAGLLKMKIKEIPITLYKDKREKRPHLNTWRDGWRHLKFMFLYSPTYLFILPGSFLTLIGLAILLPLIQGPVTIAGHLFDYHSALFGSLLIILGYQTINIGLYAKAYAASQDFNVPDKSLSRLYLIFTLERGIILGMLLFLAGFGIDLSVLLEWAQAGYKNLNEPSLVAFASTLMIIGLQTVFSSFFLSILKKDEN